MRLLIVLLFVLLSFGVKAQDTSAPPKSTSQEILKPEQLDALVAPIALYPDTLLAQVLVASTYPLEVVQAERWAKDRKALDEDRLKKEVEKQGWDSNVKALISTPSVLTMMSNKLDWTQKLGDAVLAQQPDVMDAVQRLRSRAHTNDKLKSSKEQNVTVRQEGTKQVVAIEPTNPGVVHVPYYDPAVVYGPWPYPEYPPYHYPEYYPDQYVGSGIIAAGIAYGAGYALWRWGSWGNIDWNRGNININRGAHVEHWRHNPEHRRGAAYNNQNVRQKFAGNANRPKGERDFRGRDGKQVLKPGGDRNKVADRSKSGQSRPGTGPKAKNSDRAKTKQAGQGKGTAQKRPSQTKPPTTQARRPSQQRSARNTSPRRAAQRGPSRVSHGYRPTPRGGRSFGGRGGGRSFGGRGGGRGGGRRSDIRFKRSITLLGHMPSGLGFYRFAYNGSNRLYVGVLAQQVQAIAPAAVIRDRGGYLRVDYNKLGLKFQSYDQWLASGAQIPHVSDVAAAAR